MSERFSVLGETSRRDAGCRYPKRAVPAVCLATALLVPVLAGGQSEAKPTEITSVRVQPTASGAEVQVRSAGSLAQASAFVDADGQLVVRLPQHRPGAGVEGVVKPTGPIARVEVRFDPAAAAPATFLIVRTRGSTGHSVIREGSLMRVLIWTEAVLPAGGDEELRLQLEMLQASLERSNGARAELASQAERLSAENEVLAQRVELLVSRRQQVTQGLQDLRTDFERLGEEAARRSGQLEEELAAATATQQQLRRRLEESERSMRDAQIVRQGLSEQLDAATAEAGRWAERTRSLEQQLGEARDEVTQLRVELADQQAARLRQEAAGAELAAQLATAIEENKRGFQKQAARLRLSELETANEALARDLAAARAEIAALEQRSQQRESELVAELEQSRQGARELTARLTESRQGRETLEQRIGALEASLGASEREARDLTARAEASGAVADGLRARLSALEAELAGRREAAAAQLEPTPPASLPEAGGEPAPSLAEQPVDSSIAGGDPVRYARAASRVNLRETPGVDSALIGTLAEGMTLEVLEEREDWLRLRLGGVAGWASSGYLEVGSLAELGPGSGREFGRTTVPLRLRSGPSSASDNLGSVAAGTWVEVLDRNGSWGQIRVGHQTGWILINFVDELADG